MPQHCVLFHLAWNVSGQGSVTAVVTRDDVAGAVQRGIASGGVDGGVIRRVDVSSWHPGRSAGTLKLWLVLATAPSAQGKADGVKWGAVALQAELTTTTGQATRVVPLSPPTCSE